MRPLPTSRGIAYWPDEAELPSGEAAQRSPLVSVVLFLFTFMLLNSLWTIASGTLVERLWTDEATVKSAVALINVITPDVLAYAQGPRLRAPGGGINVLNGCEGVDVLFMLIAAFTAFPMPWRKRLTGVFLGTAMIFILNVARIVMLFHAARSDKALFDLLHTLVAPIVFIATTTAYFYVWAYRERMAQAG